MRILYFTRDYTPHDYRFVSAMAQNGLDVHYLRLERGPRQMEDRPLPAVVHQVRWRGGREPFRWRDIPALLIDLKRVIRQVKPDLIHAGPIQTSAFLAALSGFRPLVAMSWGSDLLKDAYRSAWQRRVTRFALACSTVLLGDCQAVRQEGIKFGFPADRIYTFPWGIDLDWFKPGKEDPEALELRRRLGWETNQVVLSLRSWEPVYGIDVVLRGFARALQSAPELRLMMMGGGSLAPMVHQMIRQYNLADVVYLGGQIPQDSLPKIYHAADLYLSASHSDGSSVSLMEALGSGLPVLLSDIPSNREWVTEGEQGWFFPDGDDETLASRLVRAARERTGLAKAGKAARLAAEARADWNINFQVLCRAYEAAMALAGKTHAAGGI